MKLFYDLRLEYFVTAPGQDSQLTELTGKRGDGQKVLIQFGRSSDPTASQTILQAPTWTAEQLSGGSVIKIGLKLDGEYGDGALLAGTSTFTYNATDELYEGTLDLNTEGITDALLAIDADDGNDLDSLDCGFELTYQLGGSGPWSSSLNEITYTVLNDIIAGDEATPADAESPDEYPLKTEVIIYYKTVSSLTGGTAADLDYVPTVALDVDTIVGFYDNDPATDVVRLYQLVAGTDAESSPDVIRPDDYDASTNAKIWRLLRVASDLSGAVTYPVTALTYSATLTPDCNDGLSRSVAMTGDQVINAPTNAVTGMVMRLFMLASGGARELTFNAAIKTPTDSTYEATVASGATRRVDLEYNGTAWMLIKNLEFSA